MIIKPKVRGFICTTAHPLGCAENVKTMARYAKDHAGRSGPKNVLVIGSSTGYGLACRIAAAFGYGAATVGVCLERPGSGNRTGTAGYYNNAAFEALAAQSGLVAETVIGDAFSDEVKEQTISILKDKLPGGKVDLVVYSIAAPRRTHPLTGEICASVIKPIGESFVSKTVNIQTGELSTVTVEPATPEEVEGTVAVMGGEDWLFWCQALLDADVLAEGATTCAFSYLGPVLTHPVYKDGTIGKAKEDLDAKAAEISRLLAKKGGSAFVSVNKALVTQASSAIPVVPLYISLLYKLMKAKGTHEDCIQQMTRMFRRMYEEKAAFSSFTDREGRLRMDDWEMEPGVQREIEALWEAVTQENLEELADLEGYREDFYRLFGFSLPGVDYEADVPESMLS